MPDKTLRVVFISDTHTMHNEIEVPDGDILIHAGDMLNSGKEHEMLPLGPWLTKLPHGHKIVIAGNHDRCLEGSGGWYYEELLNCIPGVTYLKDDYVTVEGINIWGSPWQPAFCNWAFNLDTPEELKEKWDLIPNEMDILVTHGPPLGILDRMARGEHVGCNKLLEAVERVQPKVHVFGHIHEGYGVQEERNTTFINASVCTEKYDPINKPIVADIVMKDGAIDEVRIVPTRLL